MCCMFHLSDILVTGYSTRSIHNGLQLEWQIFATWRTQRTPCNHGLEEIKAYDGDTG